MSPPNGPNTSPDSHPEAQLAPELGAGTIHRPHPIRRPSTILEAPGIDEQQERPIHGLPNSNTSAVRTQQLSSEARIAHWTIPPYRIQHLVGSGGLADVYLAYDENLKCDVAIKCLKTTGWSTSPKFSPSHEPASGKDREDAKRFLREWQALGSMNHPHIVRARFAGESKGVPFLVMDYVPGGDLESYIDEHGMPSFPQALRWMIQSCSGLEHAHQQGMVHRDLKPSNLLLDPEVGVKISDFGISHVDFHGCESMTVPGVMMGTPDFIAPEQISCFGETDARADIYSLGCTFYYLLFGFPPFVRFETLTDKLAAHRTAQPVFDWSTTNVPLGLQGEMEGLLRQMMQKKPAARVESARKVEAVLATLQDRFAINAGAVRKSRKTGWLLGAMAAFVLAGITSFAVMFAMRGGDEPTLASLEHASSSVTRESGTPESGRRYKSNEQSVSPALSPAEQDDENANSNDSTAGDQSSDGSDATNEEILKLQLSMDGNAAVYRRGDKLQLSVVANRDCHLFVFQANAHGGIDLMFPNFLDESNEASSGEATLLPDSTDAWQLEVLPPYGTQELFCIAIQSSDEAMPTTHEPREARLLSSRDPAAWTSHDIQRVLDHLRLESDRVQPNEVYQFLTDQQPGRVHALESVEIDTQP